MEYFWKKIVKIIKWIYHKIITNQVPVEIAKENNKREIQEAQKFKTDSLEIIHETLDTINSNNSKKFNKVKLEYQNDSNARKITIELQNEKKTIEDNVIKGAIENENKMHEATTNLEEENH